MASVAGSAPPSPAPSACESRTVGTCVQPVDQRDCRGQHVLVGRRAVAGRQPERPARGHRAGRAPPTPAAGPRAAASSSRRPSVARSTRLPTASRIFCIAWSNLYFSRKNRRSITLWNRPRATSKRIRTTITESAATIAPSDGRVRREQAVADQLAADQQHPRVDQPRDQAEREVDHAAVDDVLDLHQLVARDAEGVGQREQQRDAEHRPGGVVAAQRRRVVPGLDQQVGDQERRDQRGQQDPLDLVPLGPRAGVPVAVDQAGDADQEDHRRQRRRSRAPGRGPRRRPSASADRRAATSHPASRMLAPEQRAGRPSRSRRERRAPTGDAGPGSDWGGERPGRSAGSPPARRPRTARSR